MRGLSLVAASGGHSSLRCAGLSLSRPLLLRSTGSRRAGSAVVAHGLSCSVARGIFPDQGSNPCPLHWQADSQPLRHQGSPGHAIFILHSVNVICQIYWFVYVVPSLHPRDELPLIVVNDPFNMFLNPVCWYFVETFVTFKKIFLQKSCTIFLIFSATLGVIFFFILSDLRGKKMNGVLFYFTFLWLPANWTTF